MKFNLLLTTGLLILAFSAGNVQAGGDAAAGEAKAASCAGCHGSDGKGMDPNPPLAGLDEAYFVEQMNAFKSGERESTMMGMMVGSLSEQDFADLAAYYAGLGGE